MKGLTLSRIVDGALEMADEQGFDAVTLSGLARHFGVAGPSMYSHVAGLWGLHVEMSRAANYELAERLSEAVAGRSGRDALEAFADSYRRFSIEHPGWYVASQVQLSIEEVEASPSHQRVFGIVNQVFRAYGLSDEAKTDAIRFVRAIVHGFVSLETQGGFGDPRSVETSWNQSLRKAHNALVHWEEDDPDA